MNWKVLSSPKQPGFHGSEGFAEEGLCSWLWELAGMHRIPCPSNTWLLVAVFLGKTVQNTAII